MLYLAPVDNRKSFNNKCYIEDDGEIIELYSYETKVAEYNKNTRDITITWTWFDGKFTITTKRHLNAFLSYLWLNTTSKDYL